MRCGCFRGSGRADASRRSSPNGARRLLNLRELGVRGAFDRRCQKRVNTKAAADQLKQPGFLRVISLSTTAISVASAYAVSRNGDATDSRMMPNTVAMPSSSRRMSPQDRAVSGSIFGL